MYEPDMSPARSLHAAMPAFDASCRVMPTVHVPFSKIRDTWRVLLLFYHAPARSEEGQGEK